ncbi:lysine-rich coiled-coil protein 1 isoform X2 [Neopsephotus bourkii]|uniref:lysine-rich coiled-coil protein 1 isoform X2 n=1 Tax=Neopsephotus bourkii TaxID=309878 RepID=UPI002AA5141F|nr:lysine-rich coiled-coil protein 1 isoform X2 [Neopsephotus bourkii]
MEERGEEAPAYLTEDILDEATRKDLFTNTFCKVCRAGLQFESERISHYKMDEDEAVGKYKYCSLCSMLFTSPVDALSHYLGKTHAKNMKRFSKEAHVPAQGMQIVPALEHPLGEKPLQPSGAGESSSSFNTGLKSNDPNKFCRLCCASFNKPVIAQEHYSGKKHRRNEARKRLLEEMGDKAVPVESSTSAIGVGYYICPVCNVTLTSIETWQSHLQGKKHRIKETKLASLMKKQNKTCESLQDESMDCIEVQEAKGQEPRKCLVKVEEEWIEDINIEGDLGEIISSNSKCQQGHSSLISNTQSPTNTGQKRSPSWPSACERTVEMTPNCCYNKGYCKEEQSELAISDKSFSLLAAEPVDCYSLTLAETSTNSCRKEQKSQIKRFKEGEESINEEVKYEEEAPKQKRKKSSEGADVGKEKENLNEKRKKMKVQVGLVSKKKSRPYKDKILKESPAEKNSKNPKEDKEKPQREGKIEEELLWVGSLGY